MAPRPVIRSRENAELKKVGAALAGREPETLVLEGDRLIDDALAAGHALECVLVAESRESRALELERRGLDVRRVDDALLARVSRLVTSPGILALCPASAKRSRSELRAEPRALVLVVAGLSDPGNLGALARSAEAAGASSLCVVAGGASPWNEKALRGSMGSLLRLPVHMFGSAEEAAGLLSERGFRQVRAATRDGAAMHAFDWSGPVALWVGSETGELPAASEAFERVTIPMRGAVESLNATVAASLLLYASGRAQDART